VRLLEPRVPHHAAGLVLTLVRTQTDRIGVKPEFDRRNLPEPCGGISSIARENLPRSTRLRAEVRSRNRCSHIGRCLRPD
jgi:hypothetical protein